MTQAKAPRTSTIKLDSETRARIAKEIGLKGGIDAVPEEITLVGFDPEDAGATDQGEVTGYASTANFFLNPTTAPNITQQRLAQEGLLSRRGFVLPFAV